MAAENGRRGSGTAIIMGIGKAVPVHVFPQKSFPDYYFDISNSNHMVELKAKFANICEKTMIEKRHFYTSDDLLRSTPSMTAYNSPSLTLRQELADHGVSDITHLVFSTSASGCLPGADWELVNLLGLPLSTKRAMLYQAGCYGGGTALRLAKDLAENNPGARVLVVCSEVITLLLRGPSESHIGNLVGQAIFSDAAGAEIIPRTRDAVVSKLREEGIVFTLNRNVPQQIADSIGPLIERALLEQQTANTAIDAIAPDLNEMFWVVHAGCREILYKMESKLGLGKEKLVASRAVMGHYCNTRSSCVVLVMEEMRRRSEERGLRTPGEGLDMGMLVGFGPGLTVETIILRALPVN
ncbi:hypothetical protein E2562_008136 [Oryza meyeriana var. granulata]|uniref:Chalcone/stilbene synthase N-terminal domain-containing protein n=1 Tax=Oryza meyeriana var. granulata TaxID=110450 RepID=A0A6G1CED6_9ORYZ|nr:hypothetical protein E2562_008136 [Oryza meyeriana var. granulata]